MVIQAFQYLHVIQVMVQDCDWNPHNSIVVPGDVLYPIHVYRIVVVVRLVLLLGIGGCEYQGWLACCGEGCEPPGETLHGLMGVFFRLVEIPWVGVSYIHLPVLDIGEELLVGDAVLVGYDEYENLALDSYVLFGSENAGIYYNPIFLLKNIQKVECFYKNAESDPYYSVYGTIVSINAETTLYYDTETRYAYYGSSSRDLYIAQRSLATPVIPSHTYATYLKVTAISGAASPSASVATRKYTL